MPYLNTLFGIVRFLQEGLWFLIKLCSALFCLPFYSPMRGLSVLRSIHMIVYYSISNSSPYLLFHFLVRYTSFWLLIRSICDVIRRWSESGNNVTAASSSSKLMPFDKSFICQWEGTHFWLTSRDSKVFGVWSLGLALASAQLCHQHQCPITELWRVRQSWESIPLGLTGAKRGGHNIYKHLLIACTATILSVK